MTGISLNTCFLYGINIGMRKVNKKNVMTLILMIVIASIVCVSVFLYIQKSNMKVSQSGIKQNVQTEFDGAYEMQDYVVYGQTLTLYQNAYDGKASDPMQGNNLMLRNIATDELTSFTFSGKVDSGIDMGALEEGIYELYTYDHYQKQRIYFSDVIKAKSLVTMRNEGFVKKVKFVANKNALKEYDVTFDKNYAFLFVSKEEPKKQVYDVVIDPTGNSIDYETQYVDYGGSSSLMDEQITSLEFAKKVKKELESYGLKVKILRKENETIGYYGDDSRISRAYDSGAKLYLALGASLDEDVNAPYILVSPFTNSTLGNRIAYMFEQKGLGIYNARSDKTQQTGVLSDSFKMNDNYEYTQLELYPQLRESGGKATYAGNVYGNAQYSKVYGMYGLYFIFASVNNSESVTNFNANQKQMTKYLVKGICDYFDIKGDKSETTSK